ncbi:MAG TPA: carbohydrate ABC transporter permease, partial [Desulfuromonadaceae bacterium]
TIFLTVVLSCMLAYACTRMIWKYRNHVLALITLGILLPSQIVIAPVFILICSLGLVNTRIALVLTVSAFNLAISTLIASSFLKNIPSEVEEAAVIDGAGIFRIFSAIILPILKPAISAMSISIFLSSWNEFIYALVLINSESMKTLPIMLMSFSELRTGINYGGMFAAMVLASIVPIIMYLSFSSQVENALTAGAILK